MKILLCSNTAWSLLNFRKELILMLLDRGDEVWVAAPKDEYVCKLEDLGCRWVSVSISGKGKNPLEEWSLYRSFLKLYKRGRFDYVIHYTIKPVIYGSIAARRAGSQSLAIITGLGDAFKSENWLNKLVCALYRFALKENDRVLFLNEENAETFVQRKIISQEQVEVLPGEGVDLDYFSKKEMPSSERVRFLFIGRILREKGTELLFEAFKQVARDLPDRQMELYFQGFVGVSNDTAVSREEMERWTSNPHVHYLPPVEDVRDSIESAHCIVLPSFYGEGVPRSLLEAGAMSRPIITTDNVGCREVVVSGKNGYLCQVKNIDSLAHALKSFVLLSEEERRQMGEAGYHLVTERFGMDKVLDCYRKYLTP